MTSSKFSRSIRVQTTPPICHEPPPDDDIIIPPVALPCSDCAVGSTPRQVVIYNEGFVDWRTIYNGTWLLNQEPDFPCRWIGYNQPPSLLSYFELHSNGGWPTIKIYSSLQPHTHDWEIKPYPQPSYSSCIADWPGMEFWVFSSTNRPKDPTVRITIMSCN